MKKHRNIPEEANLVALKIVQDSRAAYAKLSSYSDTGKVVTESYGKTRTKTFNICLAKPNLYRIEWSDSKVTGMLVTNSGAVWSAGDGNFLELSAEGRGTSMKTVPTKVDSAALAMVMAREVSSEASATVPGVFFDNNILNRLTWLTEPVQLADEKVEKIDCFVLSTKRIHGGNTNTTIFWIGKQDKLIHQLKRVDERASTAMTPAEQDLAAKAGLQPGMQLSKTLSFTETHENISVNKTFKKEDFVFVDQTATNSVK